MLHHSASRNDWSARRSSVTSNMTGHADGFATRTAFDAPNSCTQRMVPSRVEQLDEFVPVVIVDVSLNRLEALAL